MLTYILFIIWFVVLIKWADFLVQWASSLAKKFNISELVIWLTIVAIGTSAPELVVNMFSAFHGSPALALGNILWSNIANILLVLGVTICVYPMVIKKSVVYREIPFSLGAIIILSVFINNFIAQQGGVEILSRFEWIALLLLFGMFMIYIFWLTKREKERTIEHIETFPIKKSILFIVIWLTWLILWWERIVNGAIEIAKQLWLSELTIGLTIIAIGTSLPELATSVVAIRRKKPNLAIWNIVWSNIFNILRVLGVTATIHPLTVPSWINKDIRFAIFATAILLVFPLTKRKFTLHRYQGLIMVITYMLYLLIVFLDAKA